MRKARSRPRHLRAELRGEDVTATRSEFGLRADKSFALTDAILTLRGRAAWAHDFNPDRTIAATFQALPGAIFRRQRRSTGPQRRADHGIRRNQMGQRLLACRQVRGRILQRHPQLRRQGRGEISVVIPGRSPLPLVRLDGSVISTTPAVADDRVGRPEQRVGIGELGLARRRCSPAHPSAPSSPAAALRHARAWHPPPAA